MGLRTTLIGAVAIVGAFVTSLAFAPDADAGPGAKAHVSVEWTCGRVNVSASQDLLNVQLVTDGEIFSVHSSFGKSSFRDLSFGWELTAAPIRSALVEVGPGPVGRVEEVHLTPPTCGSNDPVRLSIDDHIVEAGDTFEVDVRVHPGTDIPNVLSYGIAYDASLVAPVTIPFDGDQAPVCFGLVGAPTPTCGPRNPDGEVLVAVVSTFGWMESSVATTLRFQALPGASGVTPLTLTTVEARRPPAVDLEVETEPGSVTVVGSTGGD